MKTLKTFLLALFITICGFVSSQDTLKLYLSSTLLVDFDTVDINTSCDVVEIYNHGDYGVSVQIYINEGFTHGSDFPKNQLVYTLNVNEYSTSNGIEISVIASGNVPILNTRLVESESFQKCETLNTSNFNDIQLNVYPNPFISYVNVDGFVQNWKLFDTTGRLIKTDSPNQENITIYDLDNLKSGAYRLIINDRKVFNIVK